MFPFYNPEGSRGWVVSPIYAGLFGWWRVSRVLRRMQRHSEAPGGSDIGVQNLMVALTTSLRPRRILEIGTHIGMGAVVVGHALKINQYGKLLTLEPAAHYQQYAARNVRAAGVQDYVEIVPYFSSDSACKERLRAEAPFELIFIDGAHDYDAVAHDLRLCAEVICDNGLILCHDVGRISPSLDPTGKGGGRQALWDFGVENPELRTIFLEFPVWLNDTGTAIVTRQKLLPDPRLGQLHAMAAQP
jgi:predicted O-methyltransferase YrrM